MGFFAEFGGENFLKLQPLIALIFTNFLFKLVKISAISGCLALTNHIKSGCEYSGFGYL
jgi:hypothetical protein